jgi:hypothetical protein
VQEYPYWDHKAELRVVDIHPTFAKAFMEKKLCWIEYPWMKGTIDFRKAYLTATPFPRPHDNIAIDAQMHGEGWGTEQFRYPLQTIRKASSGYFRETPRLSNSTMGISNIHVWHKQSRLKEELLRPGYQPR